MEMGFRRSSVRIAPPRPLSHARNKPSGQPEGHSSWAPYPLCAPRLRTPPATGQRPPHGARGGCRAGRPPGRSCIASFQWASTSTVVPSVRYPSISDTCSAGVPACSWSVAQAWCSYSGKIVMDVWRPRHPRISYPERIGPSPTACAGVRPRHRTGACALIAACDAPVRARMLTRMIAGPQESRAP